MLKNPELEPLPSELSLEAPKKILVVDDDDAQVDALEYRLANLGFRVLSASSGQQAIDVAFSESPDLILLDLRLPDMDGFEVCSLLADSPDTCGTPVIILSGVEAADIVRRSRSAGGEYYLRKPYDPNVLLTLIQNALAAGEDPPEPPGTAEPPAKDW